VGGALIQLGKMAGLRIVGVVGSSHKVSVALQLGADHVIDKSSQSLWKVAVEFSPEGYDAIFDANGVATLKGSYSHLAMGGKLIVYGFHSMLPRKSGSLGVCEWLKIVWDWLWTPSFNPMNMTTDNKSVMALNLSFMFQKREYLNSMLAEILRLFEEEKLKPLPITLYPFEKVVQAHKDIQSGLTTGKLILMTLEKED